MKVVFLIPPSPQNRKIVRMIDCSFETKANYLWQPNDYLIISSLLKPTDEIVFIDGTSESLSGDEFVAKVSDIKTADILFFSFSSVCFNSDHVYFKKLKDHFANTPIFVLGDLFLEDEYRESFLKECDGIIFQPYMLDLVKMADIKNNPQPSFNGLCTRPKEVIFTSKETKYSNGNNISFPRHEVFLKSSYVFPFASHFKFATVTIAWGCPFSCSYCSDANFAPYVRNHDDIVSELEYLNKLGVKELFIADKAFGYPYENIMRLMKEMADRFSFSWSCYHHPNLYKPELMEMMKKAGCHTMIVGIDSYNLSSLKLYKRNVNQEKVESLIDHANKLKIDVCADFIIGLEHETEEDILKTIKYSLDLPLDFASFNIATPLPGSSIRKNAIMGGKIQSGEDSFDTLGNKKVLGNNNISSERLKKLRKKATVGFYLRLSYFFRRLGRTRSLEHFMIQFLEMFAMLKKM